ncbi:daxx-like protein [Leptinotarsa decemlineata]|uniref:daxx-like protein n=1 Tax=Leptinotarsa decemlineata TaxID=7539 RepID=UPI003D30B607
MKYYGKCEMELGESTDFEQIVQTAITKAETSAPLAVIGFNDIFQYLKDVLNSESVEVTAEKRGKLKKLEKTIKLLIAKIKSLEEAEIDFDDEEDSTYLQLDRYTNRLKKVHHKYCELLEKNPYSGRLTYSKLDFSDSEYNEINRAISKKYKNNKKFPSYSEMETFIKKIAEENNLELSDSKIKSESIHCFKKLGELLQNRRRRELYDSHYMFIKESTDPAKNDPSLNLVLTEQYSEGQNKIEKIVQEYVNKQENNTEVSVSNEESSDESNDAGTEGEEDVEIVNGST